MSDRGSTKSRWRRRLGVAVLLAALVGAGLCGVSVKWWFGYCTEKWLIDFGDGTLYVNSRDSAKGEAMLLGWFGGENVHYGGKETQSWMWTWWAWGVQDQYSKSRAYSVWPIVPMLAVCGGALVWPGGVRTRRARRNECPECGYSRSGLPAEVACPECGAERRQPQRG